MGWISVKDEFPAPGMDILISRGKSIGLGYIDQNNIFRGSINHYPEDGIKYWMPLPLPPEEK